MSAKRPLKLRWTAFALLAFFVGQSRGQEEQAEPVKPGWGEVADKKGDCKTDWTGDSLTITVPGTPHNLNKEISDLNAPRVLIEVEGDFAAEVRVSGDFDPSPVSTVAPKGDPFNGAGLLLWISEDLFVRLERNIWIEPTGERVCMAPLFEVMRNGRITGAGGRLSPATFFSGPYTWLRMERKGNIVTGYLCHDDGTWSPCGQLNFPIPDKIKIGVAAVNTSKKSFTAVFDGFRIYK
jgi:regulation of enolase protein 1 (concanavalin A-like superfamily)